MNLECEKKTEKNKANTFTFNGKNEKKYIKVLFFIPNFVPVNSQGSCAAYDTAPLTVTEPDEGGSSPRIA